MRKRNYICFWISLMLLGITGCTIELGNNNITPTMVMNNTETLVPTTEEKEKKTTITSTQDLNEVITQKEEVWKVLQEIDISIEGYNSLNRKLSKDIEIGLEGTSDFCLEETTGDIYFVNQGKDYYLYQIKEGEVKLAVAMPVKQLYAYQGSIYFMISSYGKYELKDKNDGDIYCYTPESGVVELVYAVGAVESSEDHKLTVEESGIYFCYTVMEENKGRSFYYHLPFGAIEPVRDTKFTVTKGWNDYFFYITSSKLALMGRTAKEDGTREIMKLSVSQDSFCVVGDILYSKGSTNISCVDLSTGEIIVCDFLEAIQKVEGEVTTKEFKLIQSFTITEEAIWITTGAFLYRMDLQSGEVSCAAIMDENNNLCDISTLYTDGKNLYGVHKISKDSMKVVRILADSMSGSTTTMIKVKDLVE